MMHNIMREQVSDSDHKWGIVLNILQNKKKASPIFGEAIQISIYE
jgi:hypothetical protein